MSNTFKQMKMPDHLIEAKINQYHDLIIAHEMKISALKRIQTERKAVRKHRAKMNELAEFYIDLYRDTNDLEAFMVQIKAELRCNRSYAESIAAIIRRTVSRKDIAKRNTQICLLSERLKPCELASMFDLSRQQIHNILKEKSGYF